MTVGSSVVLAGFHPQASISLSNLPFMTDKIKIVYPYLWGIKKGHQVPYAE